MPRAVRTQTRRNLCLNPRAVTGAGWASTGTGGTQTSAVVEVTDHPAGVTTAWRRTWATAPTGVVCSMTYGGGTVGAHYLLVEPGQGVLVSIYGRTNRAGQTARARLTWLTFDGAVLSAGQGPATTTVAGEWVRHSAWARVPEGAARVRADYFISDGQPWAVGDWTEATAVSVELAGDLYPYFDGDTANRYTAAGGVYEYGWVGPAHASASTEWFTEPPITPAWIPEGGGPEWALFSRSPGPRYDITGGLRLVSASGVLRHLGVDTAIIETPYTADGFARTGRGCGLVLQRNGQELFSGLVASERTLGWDGQTGQATIRVQVVGDNAHLAGRIVYPDPARAGAQQSTVSHWVSNGFPASTAMLRLLSDQLGPTARPERRVAGLVLDADPGVGVAQLWRFRFDNLLDALTAMSLASQVNLGVRIVSGGDGLLATVYAPRNRADTVKFSADLRNLAGFEYREVAPEVTYALAGGRGDLTARLLADYTSAAAEDAAWGIRRETFIDRTVEDDPAELFAAARDAVVAGGGQTSLVCTLTDSAAARYGVDWGPYPGDTVTVYVGLPGQDKPATVVDVIREIAFSVDAGGAETLRPAIGTAQAVATKPGRVGRRLDAVARRLSFLETRK